MRALRNTLFATALGGLLFIVPGPADAKFAKGGGDASASFHAKATPGDLGIDGSSNDVAVSEDGGNLTITVQFGALTTGIGLRDRHTKKALEAHKFPSATFTVPRASLKAAGGEGDASGTMTIHGQSKPATVHYNASKTGSGFSVTGSTKVLLTDYGIEVPSYMGVTVKNEVGVDIRFSVVDS